MASSSCSEVRTCSSGITTPSNNRASKATLTPATKQIQALVSIFPFVETAILNPSFLRMKVLYNARALSDTGLSGSTNHLSIRIESYRKLEIRAERQQSVICTCTCKHVPQYPCLGMFHSSRHPLLTPARLTRLPIPSTQTPNLLTNAEETKIPHKVLRTVPNRRRLKRCHKRVQLLHPRFSNLP